MTTVFETTKMNPRRLNGRRFLFFSTVFFITSLAVWVMADLLWQDGITGIEIAVLVLFSILFAHIAVGFCTALAGFYIINRGGDPCSIYRSVDWSQEPAAGQHCHCNASVQ